MTSITKVNQIFEPQTAQPILLQEGPIRIIPTEIVGSILFLANHSESTRLVSRVWKALTLTADKKANGHELEQTFRLITEKLNPDTYAKCIADLAELQGTHQSLSGYVATFAEVRGLFLIDKGFGIGILRKLPSEERDQLQIAIGDQLPDSMKDVFKISKLHPQTVKNVVLDTFFTLLQSYQPLSGYQRGWAVSTAAENNNIEFVKLLLADGPISENLLGRAVMIAAKNNNLKLARLLLANGPIHDQDRAAAVENATVNNNPELVELLLANEPISEYYRGQTVILAARYNHLEIVKLLLANGPISEEQREEAVRLATKNNNPELIRLLREPSTNWNITAGLGLGIAVLLAYEWHSSK
jgi:hypothetical protein